MSFFVISVDLARGFSKSWHHVFVMSNICAFVLTWCLFVGNSRQTTSSVPWHRAPKYDRKHELTPDYKMIPLQMVPQIVHVKIKGLCCILWKKTVWIQEGELVRNAQPGLLVLRQSASSFSGSSVYSLLYTICYLHGMFDLKPKALMFTAPF